MRLAWFALFALAGCDLDFDLSFQSRELAVHSELGQITISACEDSGLLGCSDATPAPAARAILDGVGYDLPPRPADFALFPAYSRILTRRSPDDPKLGLELDYARFDAEELPWFDFDAPETVSRGQSLEVTFQDYPTAEVTAVLASDCDHHQSLQQLPPPTARGRLTVVFPALTGACTHDLQITQTLRTAPENRNLVITVERTEHAEVASVP